MISGKRIVLLSEKYKNTQHDQTENVGLAVHFFFTAEKKLIKNYLSVLSKALISGERRDLFLILYAR